MWKIEVGSYKDGRKRFEYRHVNDLKFAHPKSLAAPIERPKLGRPTTVQSESSESTEAKMTAHPTPSNRSNEFSRQQQLPEPSPVNPPPQAENKQIGTRDDVNHETSIPDRPQRSTRNPNPIYVDSLRLQAPPRAWSASESDLQWLNASITSQRY